MADHEILLVLYALATGTSLAIVSVIWRAREKAGVTWLAVNLLGTAIWAGSLLLATIIDDFALSLFFQRFLYVGVGLVVAGMFLFALEYTGRERFVRPATIGLLAIEPIVVLALVVTNPRGIFYETLEPDPTMPTGVGVEFGSAFLLHTVYSYLLLSAVTLLIIELLYNSRSLYRGQAVALLGGTVFPWIANGIHVVGPVDADLTPIGFILAASLYAVAIVRYQLVDIVPIARDRVLDTLTEGVFVIDREDRLIDVNPAGRRLLDVDPEATLLGRDVRSVFATESVVRETFRELTATRESSATAFAYDDRYYEARSTPIIDDQDRRVGWLILASDITDRKRREQRLRRQNERLDRFASLVSHDLRNPLTVADGYVDLARETGDVSHLDEVDLAHDRMEAIIEDVLALAQEGAADTDPEPVSLARLADRAWDGVDTSAASLSVETDVTILADETRTTRLLENLFRNAVEHGSTSSRPEANDGVEHGSTSSQRGSASTADGDSDRTDTDAAAALEITVGSIGDPTSGQVEGFYVADDGVGVPTDAADRLFEDGYTTADEGTGLGLSIVEEIATAHGWTVDAGESTARGARFEFTGVEIPASDDRVPPAR